MEPPAQQSSGPGPAPLWLGSARKQSYRCHRVAPPLGRAAPSAAGPRGGKERGSKGGEILGEGGLKAENGAGWEGEGTTTARVEGVCAREVKKKGAGCLCLVSFGDEGGGSLGKLQTRPFCIT